MAEFTSIVVYFEADSPAISGSHGLYIRAAASSSDADAIIANTGLLASLGITDAGSLQKSAAAVVIPRTPRFVTPLHGYFTPSGITTLAVADGGSGFPDNPAVTIPAPTGADGIQATATATAAGGVLTSLRITNMGRGYTSVPTITISGGSGEIITVGIGAGIQAEPLIRFPMRNLIRGYHDRLDYLGTLIEQARAHNRPPHHINFAEKVLHGMHQWAWGIWHDTRLNNTHRVNAFALQAQGPTDTYPSDYAVTAKQGVQIYDRANPFTFADVIQKFERDSTAEVFAAARFDSLSFVTINKDDLSVAFARRTLADAVAAGGAVNSRRGDPLGDYTPDVFDLRDGAWIEEITA